MSFFTNKGGVSGGGGGGGTPAPQTQIIDNLNSTSTVAALSANQGSVLNAMIAEQLLKVLANEQKIGENAQSILSIEQLVSDIDLEDVNRTIGENTQAIATNARAIAANTQAITNHEQLIASTTEYGHVKIDGTTVKFNADGQLYVEVSDEDVVIGDGTLDEKGIVQLTNDIDDREDIAVTPKAVKTFFENAQSSLKKQEFRFTGLPAGTTAIEFTPTVVSNDFVDLLYINTTKQEASEYSIAPKNADDLTEGYVLTLINKPIASTNVMVNLVLISGFALAGEAGKPKLTDEQRRFLTTGMGNLPIEQEFDPNTDTLLLFSNTVKVFRDTYNIVADSTAGSRYAIQFTTAISHNNKNYEIVVIKGKVE